MRFINRRQQEAMDLPVGDPFGGPAYGQKTFIGGLISAAGSLIGGKMASDGAEDAAETAAEAANPHLWWQQQEALPYLTEVLKRAKDPNSATNKARTSIQGELPGLIDLYKGMGDPRFVDYESDDYLIPDRLKKLSLAELINRGDNPMQYDTYADREKFSSLQEALLTNPESFLTGPYSSFFNKSGEEAISRNAAAQGHRQGSKLFEDLGTFGGQEGMKQLQTVLGLLGTYANNRGTAFETDNTNAYKNAMLGSDQIAAYLDQIDKGNLVDANAVNSRIKPIVDLLNLTNTSNEDPYFNKLVTLVGGNPAAAAQAQLSGGLAAAGASNNMVKNLTDLATKAYQQYSSPTSSGNPYADQQSFVGQPTGTMAENNAYTWSNPVTDSQSGIQVRSLD